MQRILSKQTAGLLIMSLLMPILAYVLTPEAYGVADVEWNDAGAFGAGEFSQSTTTENTVTLAHDMTGAVVDTTQDDFLQGNNIYDPLKMTAVTEEGDVVSNQGYVYNSSSIEGLSAYGLNSYTNFYDEQTHLLYVSDWYSEGGLYMIDTQGTRDPSDDILFGEYSTSTSPAIPRYPYSVNLESDGLLYVSTYGGLTVINTLGTKTLSDDVLIKTYTTATSPAIANNNVLLSFITDGGVLYVATAGGLSVINTQDTVSPADDVLLITYRTNTVPAIASNWVYNAKITDDGVLYVATGDGLSVINTQDTVSPSDDVLLITYRTNSVPAISDNDIRHFFLENNLIYISTGDGGLSVINTQDTVSPSDDTLVNTYTPISNPEILSNTLNQSFLDNNLLYVSSYNGGLSVIDTQGTVSSSDDTLLKSYTRDTFPTINSNHLYYSNLVEDNLLYINARFNITVIDLNEKYNVDAEYIGPSQYVSSIPTTTLAYTRTVTDDHITSLQYRTGNNTASYFNDFDDDVADEYLGDWDGWGTSFLDSAESDGTLKLSNPDYGTSGGQQYVDFWVGTGMPADHFPVGSKVSVRFRVNSDTRTTTWTQAVFLDDWYDSDGGSTINNNEWYVSSFVPQWEPFSTLGFEFSWSPGTWQPTDTFEIDYIRIEPPDSFGGWSSWSDPCTSTTCAIDPADLTGNTWIQYRLNLETDNPLTTPTIHSVSYTNGYHATGTYISNEEVISVRQQPLTFSAEDTTPDGTTIAYTYSTDSGSTWHALNNPHTFDSTFTPSTFMWKAEMTTDHATETPSIASVVLTMGMQASHTGTAISRRVQALEAEGKQIEANVLRNKYPHLFTDTADTRQLEQILSLLREVVIKMEMLATLRALESLTP